MSPADQFFEALALRVAELVVEKLRADEFAGYIDQHKSPLGRRRHCALINSGELPGTRVGRRYLARRQDVDRYLDGLRAKPSKKTRQRGDMEQQSATPSEEELAADIGLRLVKRG